MPRRRLARCFLFGSRDLWFEVPLPFFLRDSVYGLGLERQVVGAFLAGYIILYGQTQSYTPQLVIAPLRQTPPNKYVATLWALLLIPITLGIGFAVTLSPAFIEREIGGMLGALIAGIVVFALVFAVNSSVHSYLVVRYAAGDKVATDVGFYYMANAAGRLIGTLSSGALYSYAAATPALGFAACMFASSGFCFLAGAIVFLCRDDEAGLRCGPITCMRGGDQDPNPSKSGVTTTSDTHAPPKAIGV